MEMKKRVFLVALFLPIIFETIFAASLGGSPSYFAYQPYNNVFYDQQFARGVVRMENGFTLVQPASGSGSTHGASVYMDTCISVSGAIDLRSTNTIILQSDLKLDNGVTLSSGGRFYGYDRAVILGGDLKIPNGSVLHIGGRIVIDGSGNTLNIGNESQLFVDPGSTLTLRNLVINSDTNNSTNPCFLCSGNSSILALDNCIFSPKSNFYFSQGRLFIHNDVAFTGSSAFVYTSPVTSFITSGAHLYFDVGTTFSVAVSIATSANNFINMADASSMLIFNGCSFLTSSTGIRLTTGTVLFDNRVTLNSNASSNINTFASMSLTGTGGYNLTNPTCVAWSPNGNFLAVVYNGTTSYLKIFSFNGTNTPTPVANPVATGNNSYSVSWSPNGNFIAVSNNGSNTLQIFSFNGASTPVLVGSVSTGAGSGPWSAIWSPNGNYIAVANYSNNTLQVFSFSGSGNPVLAGSTTVGSGPYSATWSPNGYYIAVCCGGAALLQVYTFGGAGSPGLVGSVSTGNGTNPHFASWSPNAQFIAVVNSNGAATLQIYNFNGSAAPTPLGSAVSTGNTPYDVQWSPNGAFLVVAAFNSNELQVFSFNGSSSPTLSNTLTTGVNQPQSARWSPNGLFIAVTNAVVPGSLEIFGLTYVISQPMQSPSSAISFGNSALGSSYDATVRCLAGAQVVVNGIVNYDCVN
jgi:6-phosphogluconolactonase (cycloisomerase 2 family)